MRASKITLEATNKIKIQEKKKYVSAQFNKGHVLEIKLL